jgi:hypothetical protein
MQWSICREDVDFAVTSTINTPKFMLTVICGLGGFHVVDLMTSQARFNLLSFVDHVMKPLIRRIGPSGRRPHAHRLHVHLDNCRAHFSKISERFFVGNNIPQVSHPPCAEWKPRSPLFDMVSDASVAIWHSSVHTPYLPSKECESKSCDFFQTAILFKRM